MNVLEVYYDHLQTFYANTHKTAESYYDAHSETGNAIEHADKHDGDAI